LKNAHTSALADGLVCGVNHWLDHALRPGRERHEAKGHYHLHVSATEASTCRPRPCSRNIERDAVTNG